MRQWKLISQLGCLTTALASTSNSSNYWCCKQCYHKTDEAKKTDQSVGLFDHYTDHVFHIFFIYWWILANECSKWLWECVWKYLQFTFVYLYKIRYVRASAIPHPILHIYCARSYALISFRFSKIIYLSCKLIFIIILSLHLSKSASKCWKYGINGQQ